MLILNLTVLNKVTYMNYCVHFLTYNHCSKTMLSAVQRTEYLYAWKLLGFGSILLPLSCEGLALSDADISTNVFFSEVAKRKLTWNAALRDSDDLYAIRRSVSS